MSETTLRPYQHAMLDAICLELSAGKNRLLCKKPTGTGKTVTFAALLKRMGTWLATLPTGKGAQMLVIAHREELLDQAAQKISQANPGMMVSVEQGDRWASRYSDVIVASIQTLAAMKFRRLKRLLGHHTFRIVVVDEAHHAAASTYRTALVHLGFLPAAEASDTENIDAPSYDDVAVMEQALAGWDEKAPKDRLLVGVTATPNRSDAIGLGCVFQTIAYSYALKDAIADGWLVPLVPWVVESDVSLDAVKTTAGDFNQRDLAAAVNNRRRNDLAVAAWQAHGEGKPTIAFTVDVAHAHSLAETFQRAGVRAAAVSGDTPKDERRGILASITDGRLDVVTNCMVLTEGTDLPVVGCILHAKPTKSATLYEQMTGRGLRLFPGKDKCIVIDVVDVARRHSLQTSPVLYGLPPTLTGDGTDLRDLATGYEALVEKYPGLMPDGQRLTLKDLQAKASTFDVWTVPPLGDFGTGRTMNWVKIGSDDYRMQYPWADGTETLTVAKNMLGTYDISLTLRPPSGVVRQRTIATGLESAATAANAAETFVQEQRSKVVRLKDKHAPWRSQPASDKQLALLRRLAVPVENGLTAGQASDRIDLARARGGA